MSARSAQPRPRGPVSGLAVLLVAVLVLGIWWGGHPNDLPAFLRNALVSKGSTPVVNEAIDDIVRDYYRPIRAGSLADSSIAGAIASLHDRFSNYLTPRQYDQFGHLGRYSGIGVEVTQQRSGALRIALVFNNSPAARAGLRAGDVIVAVDGVRLAGANRNRGTALIMGPPGTDVHVTLRRAGHERTLTITRETIDTPVVASRTRTVGGHKLAVIALAEFSGGAHGQLRLAIDRARKGGARGIVLDLRHNPGGLVEEARLIASIFIPRGVIVTTRGRSQPTTTLTAAGGAISTAIPVVVLVDRDTASAAEIVTGALQDHHRAVVVGTHTFGKGVFQEVRPLSNGGALDITVGEYFTPNGHNLGGGGVAEGAGIAPNVVVGKAVDGAAGLNVALRTLAAMIR